MKALDLITSLRLEADILNAEKNGVADQTVNTGMKGPENAVVMKRTAAKAKSELNQDELSKKT